MFWWNFGKRIWHLSSTHALEPREDALLMLPNRRGACPTAHFERSAAARAKESCCTDLMPRGHHVQFQRRVSLDLGRGDHLPTSLLMSIQKGSTCQEKLRTLRPQFGDAWEYTFFYHLLYVQRPLRSHSTTHGGTAHTFLRCVKACCTPEVRDQCFVRCRIQRTISA